MLDRVVYCGDEMHLFQITDDCYVSVFDSDVPMVAFYHVDSWKNVRVANAKPWLIMEAENFDLMVEMLYARTQLGVIVE